MARPRTPTNVHVLRGTGKVHPERMRERKNEPKEDRQIGDIPEYLAEDEKKAWREIVTNVIPGVLGQADRNSVELASVLMAAFRRRETTSSDLGQLIRLLGQFGMTPSERSKINVGGKGKEENPFADE
jgi:phage terminase small subunit